MKKLLAREIPPGAAITIAVLTAAASIVSGSNPGEAPAGVVEPVVRARPTETDQARTTETDLPLERMQRAKRDGDTLDLFAPPAPPVVAVAKPAPPPPPPPPSAPPLPYRYLGRMQEGATVTVFLAKGDEALTAKVGDTLEGVWRLDAIGPASISMTFLPLNLPQPLAIPAQ